VKSVHVMVCKKIFETTLSANRGYLKTTVIAFLTTVNAKKLLVKILSHHNKCRSKLYTQE
jgi:hypothetical protein